MGRYKYGKTILSLVTISMLTSMAYAETASGTGSQEYTDASREVAGMDGTSGDNTKTVTDNRGKVEDNWLDSVIYVDVVERITMKTPYQTILSIGDKGTLALKDNISEVVMLNKEGEVPEANVTKSTEPPRYFAGGFCTVVTPAEISKSNEFTTLSCILDFGEGVYRQTEVFAGLYPDFKREMLIGLPIYASFENGTKAGFDGVMMNNQKGSLNMADEVDSARMRKLIAESALALNDTAYRYSTAYMNQLQASKIKNEVSYINTGTGINQSVYPIQNTKVLPPNPYDFFASAGIEFVSQIFSIVGKEYLYDTTPLFKMYKGKRVWVEGVITIDTKGLSQQFGLIKATKAKEAQQSSSEWIKERNKMIEGYGQQQKQAGQQGGGTMGILQGFQQ